MKTSNILKTLSIDEVLLVHKVLVKDFEISKDPIFPPGVKDLGLLESAVHRQHVGLGNDLKYPDPTDNAATLLYGICNNHAFHNGNKRTALVSMLASGRRNIRRLT